MSKLSVFDTENRVYLDIDIELDKYKEGKNGKYIGGLSVGDSFGLRMLWTHNVNVFGRVKAIEEDKIIIAHPRGSEYIVSTNNIEVASIGKEVRFKPVEADRGWFGFILIKKITDELTEDASQPSMIGTSKVSVFGSDANNHFSKDDWYRQLFELNDIEDEVICDEIDEEVD